jgi:hypothetical protein
MQETLVVCIGILKSRDICGLIKLKKIIVLWKSVLRKRENYGFRNVYLSLATIINLKQTHLPGC